MIFHMAAVDISAFDSRELLKECCTEKSPRARVVYLSTYILIQSICLCSHLVENLMEQMGVISKKTPKCFKKNHATLVPRDKNPGFMCRRDLMFMHSPHPQLPCVALIWFSVLLMGKFGQNSPRKHPYIRLNARSCRILLLEKTKQKPQLKHGRVSRNLFIGGSVWFVVPFSLTEVTLRITGGVSNSFTP